MSYARFLGGSAVYIYESTAGCLECCGCSIAGLEGTWQYKDVAAFFDHLDEHEARGEYVPSNVRPDIYRDWSNGEYARWDQTRVEDMQKYAHYGQGGV